MELTPFGSLKSNVAGAAQREVTIKPRAIRKVIFCTGLPSIVLDLDFRETEQFQSEWARGYGAPDQRFSQSSTVHERTLLNGEREMDQVKKVPAMGHRG